MKYGHIRGHMAISMIFIQGHVDKCYYSVFLPITDCLRLFIPLKLNSRIRNYKKKLASSQKSCIDRCVSFVKKLRLTKTH